jgi:hypothetical protein
VDTPVASSFDMSVRHKRLGHNNHLIEHAANVGYAALQNKLKRALDRN